MQDVVIVGVGGLGRECSQWVEDINAERRTFNVLGFLDDDTSKHGTLSHDLPVLGATDWLADRSGKVAVIVGIGITPVKRRVVEKLLPYAAGFPILRHPRAVVGRYVEIGEGSVLSPGVILTTDIRIGRFVTLNFDLTVGHDSTVADYVTLAPGVHVSGNVHIGEGADLGAGAVTVPGVAIGAWTVVGAGAAVTRSLPENCTAVGVPARPIKTRESGWHMVPPR
jgi:sugar O-acyltransferase (sialic acid O-acetyltransferase NeuD family)